MYKSLAITWRQLAYILKLSIVLHVLVCIVYIVQSTLWPWLLALVLFNHLVLTAISLWPRSQFLGKNWIVLPATAIAKNQIALTIDDGPDPEVTPKVLTILDEYQVKATFFCIGEKAQLHPDLCREIIRRGHNIENHTQHHQHTFSFLGPNGFTKEIQAAQNTIATITGLEPKFFRAPAGLRNPFLDAALNKHNLTLASWSIRGFDTKSTNPESIKAKLIGGLKAGAILLLHDGNAARTIHGSPVILEVLPDLISAAKTKGLDFITLRQAL